MWSQGYLGEAGGSELVVGDVMTETRDGVILEEVMNQGAQMAPKATKGKEPFLGFSRAVPRAFRGTSPTISYLDLNKISQHS